MDEDTSKNEADELKDNEDVGGDNELTEEQGEKSPDIEETSKSDIEDEGKAPKEEDADKPEEPPTPAEPLPASPVPTAPREYPLTLLLLFGLVLIIAVSFLMASTFDLIPNPLNLILNSRQLSQTTSPSKIPENSSPVTPVATASAKESLSVQVLNGSGVTGQAAKVKNQLLKLGYTKVETGNADSSDNIETTIAFSSRVSFTQKQEIADELKKSFATVKSQNLSSDSKFDIEITTGQNLTP